jgi:hypothetical protein
LFFEFSYSISSHVFSIWCFWTSFLSYLLLLFSNLFSISFHFSELRFLFPFIFCFVTFFLFFSLYFSILSVFYFLLNSFSIAFVVWNLFLWSSIWLDSDFIVKYKPSTIQY